MQRPYRLPNDRYLDDLMWLWGLARRPLAAILDELQSWPEGYQPFAVA